MGGGLDDGLGVLGMSGGGGLSSTSAGDVFIIGTTVRIKLVGASSCEDDDDDDRNVRPSLLWLMPESGLVDGAPSSIDRRDLVNSFDANATKRSKPELMRSCQCDSSSPSSIQIRPDEMILDETKMIWDQHGSNPQIANRECASNKINNKQIDLIAAQSQFITMKRSYQKQILND